MSTLQNPSSDPREGQLDARQPQVKNVNFKPALLESANHIQMASTEKRGLETKVISMPCKRFHFFEHQPPPARNAAVSGEKGDSPCVIRSAFTKFGQSAYFGRNSRANVVLPAPFGAAMM